MSPDASKCPKCQSTLLVTQKTPMVTIGGLVGAFVAVGGCPVAAFYDSLVGVIMVVAGLLIGIVGHRKYDALKCPGCGYSRKL